MSDFATYADLVEKIENTLARSDVTAEIPGWIDLCHAEVRRNTMNYDGAAFQMADVLVPGQKEYTVPNGNARRVIAIEILTNPIRRLTVVSMDMLLSVSVNGVFETSDYPSAFRWMNRDTIRMEPPPQTADAFTWHWTGSVGNVDPALVTSDMLEDAPDMLLYGALKHSAPWLKDDSRLELWRSLYSDAQRSFAREVFRRRSDGGGKRVQVDMMPSGAHHLRPRA